MLVLEGTTVGQPRGSHGFADEGDVEIRLSELFRHDGGLAVVIALPGAHDASNSCLVTMERLPEERWPGSKLL